MQSKQSEGDKDKVELRHDGWAQFERAVDAAVKGGPKHKAKAGAKASLQHGQPVIELFEELRLLLEQPGVPRSAADSFLQMIQRLAKCFRMKFAYEVGQIEVRRRHRVLAAFEPTGLDRGEFPRNRAYSYASGRGFGRMDVSEARKLKTRAGRNP